MRLTCPWCGLRDSDEFVFGGDASVPRPDVSEAVEETWNAYLYLRENRRGGHREFWHHERGCRRWLVVERDTLSHEILSVTFAAGAEE